MWRIIHKVDPTPYEEVRKRFPKFTLSFCAAYFPDMKITYKGKSLDIEKDPVDLKSCHIYGKKDEWYMYMNEH